MGRCDILLFFILFCHCYKSAFARHFLIFIAMIKLKIKSVFCTALLGGSFAIGHPVMAQYASMTDSVYSLREIEIKEAQRVNVVLKTAVPLKYQPVSVSSVGASILETKGIDNLNDALKQMTGIRPTMTYGGFQTFTMRGFGSPVLMLDGQRDERMNYSNSAPVPDLSSVESIELLKGPASVLYGHSAVGGILNIVRKAPTVKPSYQASVSYGSWDSRRATFGASGLIAPKLTARADVGMGDRQGWRDNGDKRFSAYLALNYKLSDKDQLELRTGFVDDWYGTETGLPVVTSDVFDAQGKLVTPKNTIPGWISKEQRFNDPADFLKNRNANLSLKYQRKMNAQVQFSNTLSYNNDDINYFSTEKLSYLTSGDAIYSTYYENNGKRTYICLDSVQRSSPLRFSHLTATLQNQMEVSWKFHTGLFKHNLLGGWSLLYLNRTSYTGYNGGTDVYGSGYLSKVSTVNPVLNQGAVLTRFSKANPRRDLTNGFFVQDLIEVSPKLKAMLAGRFDVFKFETAGSVAAIDGGRNHHRSDLNWNQSQSISLTYRAGWVYLPVETVSVYGSFATFFKPYRDVFNPSYIYVDKQGDVFVPEDGKEIFKPENGFQGEVGVRFDDAKTWRVNASAFFIRKENIRENVATVTVEEEGKQVSRRVYAQVGVVNSKGFDLEWQVRPVKQLMFDGGYTFTMAQYGDFKSNPYVEGDSRKNNFQTYAPKHMAFAWVTYGFARISFGVGVNGCSTAYTNAANTIWLPSYAVADAKIGYEFKGGLRLAYFLKNFTDKTYYEWALGNNQFVPSPGRNHLVTMSYNF